MNNEPTTHSGIKRTGIVVAILCGVTALLSYGGYRFMSEAKEKDSPSAVSVTIPLEGMSCAACVAKVKKTLKALPGVYDARVSLEQRQADIRYEPAKIAPPQLATAIDGLGFKAGTPKEKK